MILANNFLGPDEQPAKLFVSRTLNPIYQVLRNVVDNHEGNKRSDLKLLVMTMHNTNIANLLRVLTYWETYGYKKFSRFNSSIRFELVKKTTKRGEERRYFIRIIYDDEELWLPEVCGR